MPLSLPVLFRRDSDEGHTYITAVFPTEPGCVGRPDTMTCYAHIGQHASCTMTWYRQTEPAKQEEYKDLLQELRGIYGNQHYGEPVSLVVTHRITEEMHMQRLKALQ